MTFIFQIQCSRNVIPPLLCTLLVSQRSMHAWNNKISNTSQINSHFLFGIYFRQFCILIFLYCRSFLELSLCINILHLTKCEIFRLEDHIINMGSSTCNRVGHSG